MWSLCKLTLFQNWRYKYELTSKTSKQFVFVDTYSVYVVEILQVSSVFFQLQRWALAFSVLYDQGKCTIKKDGNKTWTGSPHLHTYETKVPIVFPMCKVNELIRSQFCTYLSQNLAWWEYCYLPFMAEVRVRWWVLAMAQRYHRTHMWALYFFFFKE